jgi:hypothetical protein
MKRRQLKSKEVYGDRVVIGDGQFFSIISHDEPSALNAEF